MKSKIKLIFNSKEFLFYIDLNSMIDIDLEVQNEIKNKQQYKVKSNVCEEVFQSFIDHMLNKKTPNINEENFSEYSLLSQEFDHMKDLLKLYKTLHSELNITPITNQRNRRKTKLQKKYDKYQKCNENYHNIIQILFTKNEIFSKYEKKAKILKACKKNRINLVDIMTNKNVTDENGLTYILDEEKNEAGLTGQIASNENIIVPRSIIHDSKEYIVTIIHERSFFKSQDIKTVNFPEDSEIRLIDKYAFAASSIEYIKIPPKVTRIKDHAFYSLNKIEKIEFSESSELKIIEEECFSYSNLKEISLPLSLEIISRYSFAATALEKIDLSLNTNLHSIGRSAFSASMVQNIALPSSIDDLQDGWCVGLCNVNEIRIVPYEEENIKYYDNCFILGKSEKQSSNYDIIHFVRQNIESAIIPPFIKRINSYSFNYCSNITKIEFSNKLESISIGNEAFYNSPIECIYFPSCNMQLDDEWCSNLTKLTSIFVSPLNKQFMVFDGIYLIGKSDLQNDDFDVLYFARRDIQNAIIPSFIKRIESYAFQYCNNLIDVTFSNDSKLSSIGNNAFYNTSINRISIPKNVIEIDNYAFKSCYDLKIVKLHQDSKLLSIGKNAFTFTSLSSLSVPSNLFSIGKSCFLTNSFQILELCANSDISIINNNLFNVNVNVIIMAPPKPSEKI